jgi:hypothetical protein
VSYHAAAPAQFLWPLRTGDIFKRASGGEHDTVSEIALNPQKWRKLPIDENLSTLVHEMCHLQQHTFGKPSRRGYHNREWAGMMEAVGLIPSHDGKPGGRKTGQNMSDYIEPGGRFALSCGAFLELGYDLSFHDLSDEVEGKERQNKTKFTCTSCGANAWGKPDLQIDCRGCRQPMLVG